MENYLTTEQLYAVVRAGVTLILGIAAAHLVRTAIGRVLDRRTSVQVAILGRRVSYYLVLGAVLFSVGMTGVLIRRNALIVFMSIELMLNSVNLTFVALSRHLRSMDGQLAVFFTIVVAGVEVVVGLAIIVEIFRSRATLNLDDIDLLRG